MADLTTSVMVGERLIDAIVLIVPVGDLNGNAVWILEAWHKDLRWRRDVRVVLELVLEPGAPDIKGQMQGSAGRFQRIRAHDGGQRSSAGIEAARIGSLVRAENGEVLAVPAVAPLVVVVSRVVPECPAQQVRVERPVAGVQRRGLVSLVARPVGFTLAQVDGDAELPYQRRHATHLPLRPLLQIADLIRS